MIFSNPGGDVKGNCQRGNIYRGHVLHFTIHLAYTCVEDVVMPHVRMHIQFRLEMRHATLHGVLLHTKFPLDRCIVITCEGPETRGFTIFSNSTFVVAPPGDAEKSSMWMHNYSLDLLPNTVKTVTKF